LNRVGGTFQEILNDNYFFFYPSRNYQTTIPILAGKFLTVPLNGGRNAQPGNLEPGTFAGLLTELSVRVRYKKTGRIRFKCAGNARYIS
jgi:hypothetical protein